jgi:hypothetical protein
MTSGTFTSSPEQGGVASLARAGLSLGIAGLVFWILRWSAGFMKDRNAPQELLLAFYNRLGMTEAAAALGQSGLNPLTAKLMIAAVALLVGVAGVWVLFWVANDLIGR